jgi:hypothetical protein
VFQQRARHFGADVQGHQEIEIGRFQALPVGHRLPDDVDPDLRQCRQTGRLSRHTPDASGLGFHIGGGENPRQGGRHSGRPRGALAHKKHPPWSALVASKRAHADAR